MQTLSLSLLAAAIALGPIVADAQSHSQAPATCSTLVTKGGSFYVEGASGGERKVGTLSRGDRASISPDGALVASYRAGGQTFAVTDASGKTHRFNATTPASNSTRDKTSELSNSATGALLNVDFVGDDVLRLRKHLSKDLSRFEFYRLDIPMMKLIEVAPPALGSECALSARYEAACVVNDSIEINGTVAFRQPALNTSVSPEMMRLKLGGSALATSVRGLSIQVVSLKEGVTLRAGLPGANWTQSRVGAGNFMSVQTSAGLVALKPVLDSNTGTVAISIKPIGNTFGLKPILTWMPDSSGLATVRFANAGSEIVLLKFGANSTLKEINSVRTGAVKALGFSSPSRFWFDSGNFIGGGVLSANKLALYSQLTQPGTSADQSVEMVDRACK